MQPPDEAPLYEIKHMLQYMLDVVNDFHLAIFSLKNSYSLTDALDVISQLREAMSQQCKALQVAFSSVADCAKVYSSIPSEIDNNRQQAEAHIGYVDMRTEYLVVRFRDADAGIAVGSQYFRQVVEKMHSALSSIDSAPPHEDGPRTFLYNAKNPKVAENLLLAFSRAAKACRVLADYYHSLNEHLQSMDDTLDTLHPPLEEVEVVGKLWDEHREHAQRLSVDLTDIGLYMHKAEPYILPSKPPYQSTSTALPGLYTKPRTSNPPPTQPIAVNNPPQSTSNDNTSQGDASTHAVTVIPKDSVGLTTGPDPSSPTAKDKGSAPTEGAEVSLALVPISRPRPSILRRIRERLWSCTRLKYFQD